MFNYIGIDVSKATLQVYIPITDENISIENSKKALDNRSKSDIIDAEMLYKFHVMLSANEISVPIINSVQEELSEMLTYFKFIQKERVSFSNHLEALDSKNGSMMIIKKLKQEIKHLRAEEKEMIISMKELLLSDLKMKQDFENITSMIGIGDRAAIALLHLFITYPEANRQEIVALCGLDAIENSSGTSIQRKTRISKKGSSLYRSMLFMPVLSAIQHNPYMKIFYERLKNNGKHTTVAQIAVMRKMILIAHSLYKNNVKFNEKIYEKSIGI
jgi:transposase